MQKLGAVSVVELVRLALKAGVAPAQPGTDLRGAKYSSPRHSISNSPMLTNYFA
jgi:hypothetical protein